VPAEDRPDIDEVHACLARHSLQNLVQSVSGRVEVLDVRHGHEAELETVRVRRIDEQVRVVGDNDRGVGRTHHILECPIRVFGGSEDSVYPGVRGVDERLANAAFVGA
jgi:hypothetical protein